jgi:hypothetical protein
MGWRLGRPKYGLLPCCQSPPCPNTALHTEQPHPKKGKMSMMSCFDDEQVSTLWALFLKEFRSCKKMGVSLRSV